MLTKTNILILCLWALVSCSSEDFANHGDNENGSPSPEGVNGTEDSTNADPSVFEGRYRIQVSGKDPEDVYCSTDDGFIHVKLDSVIKKGAAKCDKGLHKALIGEISIEDKVLGKDRDLELEDVNRLGFDPRLKYSVQSGDTIYSPAVPTHVVPIIQGEDMVPGWSRTINGVTAVRTPSDPEDEDGVQHGSGDVTINIIEVHGTYTSKTTGDIYNNVLYYEILATGFEEMKRPADSGLYPRIAYRWAHGTGVNDSLKLLSVEIQGKGKDFKSGTVDTIGSFVLFKGSEININLELLQDITSR